MQTLNFPSLRTEQNLQERYGETLSNVNKQKMKFSYFSLRYVFLSSHYIFLSFHYCLLLWLGIRLGLWHEWCERKRGTKERKRQ